MKAETQYTDLTGTVAADISDLTTRSNQLHEVASYFKIDQKRFEAIGVSIHGTEEFYVSFICIDKSKSSKDKEFIVNINIESKKEEILSLIFKRLHIILYDKFDMKYRDLEIDEELDISDI